MTGVACSVCVHPAVAAINAALLGGERDSVVARRWQLGPDAVRRHRISGHFPPATQEVEAPTRNAAAGDAGDDAASLIKKLRNGMIAIGQDARSRGDGRLALASYDKATQAIELLAKLEGKLLGGGVNVTTNIAIGMADQNLAVACAVLEALRDFPEAKAKVAAALSRFQLAPAIEHEGEG